MVLRFKLQSVGVGCHIFINVSIYLLCIYLSTYVSISFIMLLIILFSVS